MVKFTFNPEKDAVEEIVDPEKIKREEMRKEIEALKTKAKVSKLTPDDERKLWGLKKRVGDIEIPSSDIHTGQYL